MVGACQAAHVRQIDVANQRTVECAPCGRDSVLVKGPVVPFVRVGPNARSGQSAKRSHKTAVCSDFARPRDNDRGRLGMPAQKNDRIGPRNARLTR